MCLFCICFYLRFLGNRAGSKALFGPSIRREFDLIGTIEPGSPYYSFHP